MIVRRILQVTAAVAAVAAAACVCIVAASFAVYALAREWLGPAGGAAVVTGVFALIALLIAWIATRKVVPKGQPAAAEATTFDRLIRLAQEKPLVALGAAAAVATVLIRKPALITAVISAFMAGNATRPEK